MRMRSAELVSTGISELTLGPLKVVEVDLSGALTRSLDGSLVDEVGEVGTAHAGAATGDDGGVDVGSNGDLLHVVLENGNTTADVRKANDDVTVETTGTGEGLIERLGEVGSGDDDDTLSLLETVELDEELVEGLLHVVLVLCRTLRSDSVELVDEHDSGGLLAGSGKELTNALG